MSHREMNHLNQQDLDDIKAIAQEVHRMTIDFDKE